MGGSFGSVGVSFVLPLLVVLDVDPEITDPKMFVLEAERLVSRVGFSVGLERPITAVHVSSEIDVLATGG